MKLNILIVTAHRWDSRVRKHNAIRKLMTLSPSIEDVSFTVQYRNLGKPELYTDRDGTVRITEAWFEQNISKEAKAKGFTHAGFIFSVEEGNRWGISHGHRGSNLRDGDFFGEFWVKANETTVRRYDNGQRNTYEVVVPHEIGHEITRQGLTDMEMHDYDFRTKINNIEGFYQTLTIHMESELAVLIGRTIDIIGIQIMRLRDLLWRRAMYPVPNFKTGVTQGWMGRNTIYDSGYHNGCDIRAKKGDPIKAPFYGKVYQSGKTPELGYYCFFEAFIDNKMRWYLIPHLSTAPQERMYVKGETLGYVGGTGKQTATHFHITAYTQKPVSIEHHVELVKDKNAILRNTVDPFKELVFLVDGEIV